MIKAKVKLMQTKLKKKEEVLSAETEKHNFVSCVPPVLSLLLLELLTSRHLVLIERKLIGIQFQE